MGLTIDETHLHVDDGVARQRPGFNNTIRNWDSYNRGLPPSLNSLREIQRWDFLLVRAELPTSWTYDEFLP